MDVFSKSERSEIMSKVLSKNNKLEISVRKYLFSKGFRYRKNVEELPGKPDIVLPKYKTILFIHGCFWHGHENCKAATLPTSNIEYWTNKIKSNVKRDLRNKRTLKNSGWEIIILWECELKSKFRDQLFSRLIQEILNVSILNSE